MSEDKGKCDCGKTSAVAYAKGPHHAQDCTMWAETPPERASCECVTPMQPYLRSERGSHHAKECAYWAGHAAPRRTFT